jgi:NAD(P)-dependent dehydrogenase (short-subunit alcohol dehydrogenase family)
MGVYCASKHAVEGLGKCLQLELAPWNIRVCHINPGFMHTALIDSTFDVTLKEFTDADTAITSQYDVAILRTFQQMVHKFMDVRCWHQIASYVVMMVMLFYLYRIQARWWMLF